MKIEKGDQVRKENPELPETDRPRQFFSLNLIPVHFVTCHIRMTVIDTPGPQHVVDELITVAMKGKNRPNESDVVEFIDKHHPKFNSYDIQSLHVVTFSSVERAELDQLPTPTPDEKE